MQSLVLHLQVLNIRLELFSDILQLLFTFVLEGIKLCSGNVKLSLRLIVVVLQSFIFLHLLFDIDSVPGLKVLLDFHSQDIRVYRKSKLLCHLIQLSLLQVEHPLHIIDPCVHIDFYLLSRLNFFT